jgi:casein kinase 1
MNFEKGHVIREKYKIINKIGAGSFGTIYKAENIATGQEVAIKAEFVNTTNPMVIFEANVTMLLYVIKV